MILNVQPSVPTAWVVMADHRYVLDEGALGQRHRAGDGDPDAFDLFGPFATQDEAESAVPGIERAHGCPHRDMSFAICPVYAPTSADGADDQWRLTEEGPAISHPLAGRQP